MPCSSKLTLKCECQDYLMEKGNKKKFQMISIIF